MKTRIGFVTNSSSSSFILAYNSKNVVSEIWEQLESKYDEIQAGEYLGYLMEYLNKADNEAENIDDFLSEQADNFRWEEKYQYIEDLERKGYSYKRARTVAESEEGQAEIQNRVQKRVKELCDNIKDFDTVKKINIPDDYEPLSSLEHTVVRNLKECKDVKSCH